MCQLPRCCINDLDPSCVREGDDDSEAQELDYAEQTQLIAKKAKLALVNRQIEELKRAKKTISSDYASADAQLMLAEVSKDFHFPSFAVYFGTLMVWGTPRLTESRVLEDQEGACVRPNVPRNIPQEMSHRGQQRERQHFRSVSNQLCCRATGQAAF